MVHPKIQILSLFTYTLMLFQTCIYLFLLLN